MRTSILASVALLGLAAAPARAADLNLLITPINDTVAPPRDAPDAFTPAPTPNIDAAVLPISDRAGNADDAGPINSTPLSSNLSPSVGVGPNASAVLSTDPTADSVPSTAGND